MYNLSLYGLKNSSNNFLVWNLFDFINHIDFNSINNLHVPVNRPILIRLTSKDVIHSFKVPVLRLTQDAIPGQEIPFWFEATKTGGFDIACAQLCGLGHYRMRGQLNIQTQADFEAWLAEQVEEEDDGGFAF